MLLKNEKISIIQHKLATTTWLIVEQCPQTMLDLYINERKWLDESQWNKWGVESAFVKGIGPDSIE